MISIIIPTFNEEKCLPRLLDSIKKQTFSDYEIIIADNNSSDRTRQIAQEQGSRLVSGGTPAVGRNAGAAEAGGDYILFLDADVILPKNFLQCALDEFNERYLEIATPVIHPDSDLNIDKLIFFFTNLIIESAQYFYPHAPGACILTTRRLHQRIGGFNQNLKMSEDHDYVERAMRLAKYGILKKCHVFISVRRLENEGRLNLMKKYFLLDVYRFVTKKVDKEIVPYEFGNFEEAKELSKAEQYLEKTIGRAKKLKDSFNKFIDET
jgi:glycosyltransferase involved in cell wall biosynthesis